MGNGEGESAIEKLGEAVSIVSSKAESYYQDLNFFVRVLINSIVGISILWMGGELISAVGPLLDLMTRLFQIYLEVDVSVELMVWFIFFLVYFNAYVTMMVFIMLRREGLSMSPAPDGGEPEPVMTSRYLWIINILVFAAVGGAIGAVFGEFWLGLGLIIGGTIGDEVHRRFARTVRGDDRDGGGII